MNLIAEMSWIEVQEYLTSDDRVILPLGAIEEHGRHLGLGTDSIEAETLGQRVSVDTGVILAPTLNYGMSMQQMGFPGTLSLRPATLITVLEDIIRALYHHGFRRVFILNGHGGNRSPLYCAIQDIAQDLPALKVKIFEWWMNLEVNRIIVEQMGEQAGSHASFAETAFMMAVRPEAVKLDRLTGRDAPVQSSWEVTTVNNFASRYPDGIMGLNPHSATAEAGEALLRKAVEICVKELKEW